MQSSTLPLRLNESVDKHGGIMKAAYISAISLLALASVLQVVHAFLVNSVLTMDGLGQAGIGMFGIALAMINLLFLLSSEPGWIVRTKAVASNGAGFVFLLMTAQVSGSWILWSATVVSLLTLMFSMVQARRMIHEGGVE